MSSELFQHEHDHRHSPCQPRQIQRPWIASRRRPRAAPPLVDRSHPLHPHPCTLSPAASRSDASFSRHLHQTPSASRSTGNPNLSRLSPTSATFRTLSRRCRPPRPPCSRPVCVRSGREEHLIHQLPSSPATVNFTAGTPCNCSTQVPTGLVTHAATTPESIINAISHRIRSSLLSATEKHHPHRDFPSPWSDELR